MFIKEVCNMLMEYSNEENLINIIKKVKIDLKFKNLKNNIKLGKQINAKTSKYDC